jgi:hypothetical protein
MKALLTLIACLAWSLAVAAPTYEWVDEHGHPVYSDRPVPGARTVPIRSPVGAGQPAGAAGAATEGVLTAEGAAPGYRLLRVVNPVDEETIHDDTGTVGVVLELEPPPRAEAGIRIRVYLDAELLPETYTSTSLTLSGIPRGAHTLRADLVDDRGRVLVSSAPITFYLWQASGIFQSPSTFPKAPTAPTAPAAPRAP